MSLLPPPLFVQISLSSLGLSENSKNHPNTHQSITNSWRRWVLGPSSIGAQLEPFMQEPVSKSPAERKAGNQRWATSLTPGRFVKNKTIVLLLCYFLAFRWVLDGSSSLVLLCVIEMASFGWMSAIISARSEMEMVCCLDLLSFSSCLLRHQSCICASSIHIWRSFSCHRNCTQKFCVSPLCVRQRSSPHLFQTGTYHKWIR